MELLVRTKDKIGTTPELCAQCTKRGDVIVAMPDGHNWGTKEIANPDWRIIRVPDLGDSRAKALVAAEPLGLSPHPRKRGMRLDLDALGDATEFTAEQIAAFMKLKK